MSRYVHLSIPLVGHNPDRFNKLCRYAADIPVQQTYPCSRHTRSVVPYFEPGEAAILYPAGPGHFTPVCEHR